MPTETLAQQQLLTTRDVCAVLSCSRWSLRRLVRSGEFPQPIRITGAHGQPRWLAEWVDSWISEKGRAASVAGAPLGVEPLKYICTSCGRTRDAHRCGCKPSLDEAQRLLRMARTHRAAAAIHPGSAEANLRDAERLERLALQGRRETPAEGVSA